MSKEDEVRLMLERIDHNTKHHPLDEGRIQVHQTIREAARDFMRKLAELCPPSRETSLALTKAEEAMLWEKSV